MKSFTQLSGGQLMLLAQSTVGKSVGIMLGGVVGWVDVGTLVGVADGASVGAENVGDAEGAVLGQASHCTGHTVDTPSSAQDNVGQYDLSCVIPSRHVGLGEAEGASVPLMRSGGSVPE